MDELHRWACSRNDASADCLPARGCARQGNKMPKPQGTHLRIQTGQNNAAHASDAKKLAATSKADEEARFFQALEKTSETQLKAWHKAMVNLVTVIKKNEPMSKEDKVRKAVAGVLGEVKKVLTQAKNLKTLEARLQQPATTVIRAPNTLGPAGAELALVIAIVEVLAILARLRGKRPTH
jgi:hypothetical protein